MAFCLSGFALLNDPVSCCTILCTCATSIALPPRLIGPSSSICSARNKSFTVFRHPACIPGLTGWMTDWLTDCLLPALSYCTVRVHTFGELSTSSSNKLQSIQSLTIPNPCTIFYLSELFFQKYYSNYSLHPANIRLPSFVDRPVLPPKIIHQILPAFCFYFFFSSCDQQRIWSIIIFRNLKPSLH